MSSATDGDVIPIFPLSNVVLLPKLRTPLYIFEPRYRQMTIAAMADQRRIGMMVVLPQHIDEMLGDPPIFPIGCEGAITHCQERPDGTFHIALLGTRRIVVREEVARTSDVLFRSARIEALQDLQPESDRPLIRLLRNEVSDHVNTIARHAADWNQAATNRVSFESVDDETLVNALCQSINFSALERQGLLEANSILERFEKLSELLRFRLAEDRAGGKPGPETLH